MNLLDIQNVDIESLSDAIRVLHLRNKDNVRESTNVLAAIIASYNGRITLDGNIIDAIVNNKNRLEVKMSEPAADGSRTLTLVEHCDEEARDDNEEEPTDEQLDEIEMSRDIFLDDEEDDEDPDDIDNLVPA